MQKKSRKLDFRFFLLYYAPTKTESRCRDLGYTTPLRQSYSITIRAGSQPPIFTFSVYPRFSPLRGNGKGDFRIPERGCEAEPEGLAKPAERISTPAVRAYKHRWQRSRRGGIHANAKAQQDTQSELNKMLIILYLLSNTRRKFFSSVKLIENLRTFGKIFDTSTASEKDLQLTESEKPAI